MEDLFTDDKQQVLIFFVNGKKVTERNPDPEWTLLWYLRRRLQLTGTKYGCGEGGCGACTVMVSYYLRNESKIKHITVNACLTSVCSMHGMAVTTIEGIGSTQERLHPVQERLAKAHGSQCGFCTPGIVMSMYTLLRNKIKLEYTDIEKALQGNLCRCTGYRPIIEGFKTFVDGWKALYVNGYQKDTCLKGNQCCRLKKSNANDNNSVNFNKSSFLPYDPTQEPIFPPELKLNDFYGQALYFKGEDVEWIRPKSLKELLEIKNKYPHSKLVAGNTEVSIEMKLKKSNYPILVSPVIIPEMTFCDISNKGLVVGACVTLSELEIFLEKEINVDEDKIKVFKAIKNMLHWFAGCQIRNVASLVGNIITASPISDFNPILMACSATLIVWSQSTGCREIVIDENFFISYRKTNLEFDEVVVSVIIPFTKPQQYFYAYKQAKRREDDISIVTAAFNLQFVSGTNEIFSANLCFGGMGPTTLSAVKTSRMLKRLQWDNNALELILENLNDELRLDSSVPGGMADYRKSLCLSLFFRFYIQVFKERKLFCKNIPNSYLCGSDSILLLEPSSSQYFENKGGSTIATDTVGKSVMHSSALKQVTGEAIYCDDLPQLQGELYLVLVFSKEAHAKIKYINYSNAVKVPGVKLFLSALDLNDECNKYGPIIKDEEIFARDIVTSRSCVIGAIVAETEKSAKKARDLVEVKYEKIEPVIVTLEEAITQQSFFDGSPMVLKKGDVNEIFHEAKHVLEGYVRSGAQEHFYLETISAFALRKEDEIEITSTSQNPAEIGQIVAHALQLSRNKVISKVKRIGGGFGGKETRASFLAVPVAIAAYKLNKPVRAVLDREEDMQVSGYRHPFLIKYKVSFTEYGKITAAQYYIYSNAGNSMDISCSMIERALMHVDNCYFIQNFEAYGYLCKTNLPSNTAFRGFGAPQAMFAAENMIRDIAAALHKNYEEIVKINLYKEGDATHFNQTLKHCTLSRCWNECVRMSNLAERKEEVEEFNRLNRWQKKGLALVPTKFGISFQVDVLMQGGVLLHVYNDGSVLLSLGGIEMGQGLFTKMIQVASKSLQIDITKIHISEMSTDKVPNSSPTAASVSSDLYGMAVINACEKINKRLERFKLAQPEDSWEDWVLSAYVNRVSLSSTGFYAAPKITYNKDTNSGDLFEYFTFGVACSEVIIDCLTGDHQVLRTDILMDIGESINPAIDIGQIEGAFIQGYGYYTMEEMIFSPTGEVLSRGPGTYKIPGCSDIPKIFNVSLLKGAPNPRAVYSSKAVGEPPLFLAASVFFAIKEAIKSARIDAGVCEQFDLDAPATSARIRMACEDNITKLVKPTIKINGIPWNVMA